MVRIIAVLFYSPNTRANLSSSRQAITNEHADNADLGNVCVILLQFLKCFINKSLPILPAGYFRSSSADTWARKAGPCMVKPAGSGTAPEISLRKCCRSGHGFRSTASLSPLISIYAHSCFFTIRTAFVPPNAKEFDMTVLRFSPVLAFPGT